MNHKFAKIGVTLSFMSVAIGLGAWLYPTNNNKQSIVVIQHSEENSVSTKPSSTNITPNQTSPLTSNEIDHPLQDKRNITVPLLVKLTRGMLDSRKAEIIIELAPKIKGGVTIEELKKLTYGMLDSKKLSVIKAISPNISGPINEDNLGDLLGGMLDSLKQEAIMSILGNNA